MHNKVVAAGFCHVALRGLEENDVGLEIKKAAPFWGAAYSNSVDADLRSELLKEDIKEFAINVSNPICDRFSMHEIRTFPKGKLAKPMTRKYYLK